MSDRPRPLTVVVADSHPLFLEAAGRAVRQDPAFQLVSTALDGKAAVETIAKHRPDVAVLSSDLPSFEGGDVLRALVRNGITATRAVFLTERCTPERAYEALAVGATACLDKQTTGEELCRAIAAAGRGDVYLGVTAQNAVATEIRLRAHEERPLLTPREHEILSRIARGQTLPEIAAELHLGLTTVKSHAANLYAKLGVNDRAAAVAEAMRRHLID